MLVLPAGFQFRFLCNVQTIHTLALLSPPVFLFNAELVKCLFSIISTIYFLK